MRQLLITAFEDAVAQIRVEGVRMPLTRWNESVFRFMYSRAIAMRERDVTQRVERSRIDLVFHRKSERAFAEFKFYTHSVAYNAVTGAQMGRKGYPSPANRREFENCAETRRRRSAPPEALKLAALFYADPAVPLRKRMKSAMAMVPALRTD